MRGQSGIGIELRIAIPDWTFFFFFPCRKHGIHLGTLLTVPYLKSWKCFRNPFGLELRATIDGYTFKRKEVFERRRWDEIQFTNRNLLRVVGKRQSSSDGEARPGHRPEIYNGEREVSLWKPYSDNGSFRFTQSLIESGARLEAKL